VLVDEGLSQLHTLQIVHVEHGHTGADRLRATDEHDANPLEVTVPALPARMEEQNDVARKRVAAAQIWSLLRLQRWQHQQRLSGPSLPPCCLAMMCST
jgi:hypothetical protein